MASNVFGIPITNATLEGMPEYAGKTITRKDRADVALNLKNSGDKDVNARTYVENLKQQYGSGVSTLFVFYNATGDTIRFHTTHNWSGHIGAAPYPQLIANGQWGGFLHVHNAGTATGSVAGASFSGKNAADAELDWCICWSNPFDRNSYDNQVYTEVRESSHYDESKTWDTLYDLLVKSGLHGNDKFQGAGSTIATGSDTSAIVEAIFTLEDA